MSDMRFIIIGIILTFLGFLILGTFGNNYQASTLESNEFGTCYEYFKDKPPLEINCSFKIFDQSIFFGIVLAFIVAGILSLIKGARGDWDSKIKYTQIFLCFFIFSCSSSSILWKCTSSYGIFFSQLIITKFAFKLKE